MKHERNINSRLYLFPKFLEDQATEHLLGNGIKPEHLNDYKIGRVISEIEIRENQVDSGNNTYQITGKIQPNHDVIESYYGINFFLQD